MRYRMRIIRNEKGIALVMVLLLSLIGLAMVSALIFMVTQGTSLSGAMRFYRTADEAAVGVADFTGEYIFNRGAMPVLNPVFASGCSCGDPAIYTDNIDLDTVGLVRSCRCDKLCNPTSQYNAGGSVLCDDEDATTPGLQISVDPLLNPDGPPRTLGNYSVTYKIVDTVEGNTDPGILAASGTLIVSGVIAASGSVYNPPHFPFLYRVEVMAQSADPLRVRERARVSMLYGW